MCDTRGRWIKDGTKNGGHFPDGMFNTFCWMKIVVFYLKFHWCLLFLVVQSTTTLKQKCRHFDEIFITGCTGSCHFDNFQCSQWWTFHQNEDFSVSVKIAVLEVIVLNRQQIITCTNVDQGWGQIRICICKYKYKYKYGVFVFVFVFDQFSDHVFVFVFVFDPPYLVYLTNTFSNTLFSWGVF